MQLSTKGKSTEKEACLWTCYSNFKEKERRMRLVGYLKRCSAISMNPRAELPKRSGNWAACSGEYINSFL